MPNPNHSSEEHYYFFKHIIFYNLARFCYSLLQTSNAEVNTIASITFIYIYVLAIQKNNKKKTPTKKENSYNCKKISLSKPIDDFYLTVRSRTRNYKFISYHGPSVGSPACLLDSLSYPRTNSNTYLHTAVH